MHDFRFSILPVCLFAIYKTTMKYVARITGKTQEYIDEYDKTEDFKTLLAVTLGSVLVSGSALAESSTMDKAQNTANTAGKKIDSSTNKVGNFMDDSLNQYSKSKAALVDDEAIKSTDASVKPS